MSAPQYIAVEGPIGVGKTTLTHRLAADLGAELLLEAPDDNPFLQAFYDDPGAGHAFQVQLCFLLQRARQIDGVRQGDLFRRATTVADFFFDKDPLFAEMTLSEADFALYSELFERLAWKAPRPDVVVYLHAPVEVLAARVRQRARAAERSLTPEYLAQVAHRYQGLFADYRGAPVVVVDAAEMDLVASDVDYAAVRDAVCAAGERPGRVTLPD